MEARIREAVAIVSHGGPGSIMLCASVGKKAIVVPREKSRGEHVDDHQVAFSRRVAAAGVVELAETRERLFELLDLAVTGRTPVVDVARASHSTEAVQTFERLVDELLADGRQATCAPKALSSR